MSFLSKDNLIPVASIVAGMLVTFAFFQWQFQPDPTVEAAVKQFDELPESDQTNVRNIAGAHLKNPEYSKRIEAIHDAVEKDPSLLPKLTALDELLRKQDPRMHARLRPEGKFLSLIHI